MCWPAQSASRSCAAQTPLPGSWQIQMVSRPPQRKTLQHTTTQMSLFNTLRGGVFNNQYQIYGKDLRKMLRCFNRAVFARNKELLEGLPESLHLTQLQQLVSKSNDPQLQRLCLEYLPITFGRRHGDPSRPWNKFTIRLRDSEGNPLIAYEGNWRDIFQNWEALAFSFPGFVESMIAKFVNASIHRRLQPLSHNQ